MSAATSSSEYLSSNHSNSNSNSNSNNSDHFNSRCSTRTCSEGDAHLWWCAYAYTCPRPRADAGASKSESGGGSSNNNSNCAKGPIKSSRKPKVEVTKPVLERRRRARINRCIDQLEDLLGQVMQKPQNSLGESAKSVRLDRGGVLELAVTYIKSLQERCVGVPNANPGHTSTNIDDKLAFRKGFAACISEVQSFFTAVGVLTQVCHGSPCQTPSHSHAHAHAHPHPAGPEKVGSPHQLATGLLSYLVDCISRDLSAGSISGELKNQAKVKVNLKVNPATVTATVNTSGAVSAASCPRPRAGPRPCESEATTTATCMSGSDDIPTVYNNNNKVTRETSNGMLVSSPTNNNNSSNRYRYRPYQMNGAATDHPIQQRQQQRESVIRRTPGGSRSSVPLTSKREQNEALWHKMAAEAQALRNAYVLAQAPSSHRRHRHQVSIDVDKGVGARKIRPRRRSENDTMKMK